MDALLEPGTVAAVVFLVVAAILANVLTGRTARRWNLGLTVFLGGVFLVFALREPEARHAHLFFAILAFGLAFRSWKKEAGAG